MSRAIIAHSFLLIMLCNSLEDNQTSKKIRKNGYMLSKSSCNRNYTSSWSKEHVQVELKSWIKSIQIQKQLSDNANDIWSNVYVKLSKNSITNEVIVTSVGKFSSPKDRSKLKFLGWTKSLCTSDDQFHDGFYYGQMIGINGEISGLFS